MKLSIVQPSLGATSETFLRAHAQHLPFDNSVVYFDSQGYPSCDGNRILSDRAFPRFRRKIIREVMRRKISWEIENQLSKFFRQHADVVLAEYGPTAVRILPSCKKADVPLVVHFHGYDASKFDVLELYKERYLDLFDYASAIVTVSNKMRFSLVDLGAPPGKVFVNPCGVDTEVFKISEPDKAPPVFLSVGRFVEKKAPYLTLLAFSNVVKDCPDARLEMIGDGPLLGICKDIAKVLRINHAVLFCGSKDHEFVVKAMQRVRCFIQHSIQSSDGDCEGMPVAVMEAMASGIPVVSTIHAGIPDTVIHGENGFLVEEKNVESMAFYMKEFLKYPDKALNFGKNGREFIFAKNSREISIKKLSKIIIESKK